MKSSEPGRPLWFDEIASPRGAEPLSRERIVAVATQLADQEPSGEVTMRALATSLGVRSPMALYRYVGSKNGLADLMADQVYGLFTVPRGGGRGPGPVGRGAGGPPARGGRGPAGGGAAQPPPWFARLPFSPPPLGPHALALYDAAL